MRTILTFAGILITLSGFTCQEKKFFKSNTILNKCPSDENLVWPKESIKDWKIEVKSDLSECKGITSVLVSRDKLFSSPFAYQMAVKLQKIEQGCRVSMMVEYDYRSPENVRRTVSSIEDILPTVLKEQGLTMTSAVEVETSDISFQEFVRWCTSK